MKLAWTPRSLMDRGDIWDHIALDDPLAADRMDRLFSAKAEQLLEVPFLGKAGIVDGTREIMAHRHYRLIYEIQGEIVVVLAIVHTSRLWPPS